MSIRSFKIVFVITMFGLISGCSIKPPMTPSEVTPTLTLAMPYYDQYDNAEEGWRACNITSVAMVLDFYQISPAQNQFARTPDYLHARFGIQQQPKALAKVFNTVAQETNSDVRDHFFEQGTIEQLQTHLQSGHPAIVHGWFTRSGHIMVVTGYDGKYYTVNDPAGRWNLKKYAAGQYDKTVSGHGIKYPAEAFEYAINDNGTGDDLWLHLFSKTKLTP